MAFSLSPGCVCALWMTVHVLLRNQPRGLCTSYFSPRTHRTRFSAVLQTLRQLVSCAGSCARAAAAQGTQGGPRGARGPGCANRGQWGTTSLTAARGRRPPAPRQLPVGAAARSRASWEQDLALMASTICHQSQGRRTRRTELLRCWQRGS